MWNKVKLICQTVKIEHTVFALPFAYLGLTLGERGLPRLSVFLYVTAAMVGLRTSGMLLNRILDADIDRKNPRTKNRSIPAGTLGLAAAWWGVAVSTAIYFWAAAGLNKLCFLLSPIPFVLALIYPFLKRITALCHFGIGIILAGAPLGGYLASEGTFRGAPFLISAAVLFWVAGFDIIYALQDFTFDRAEKLFSIPALLGEKTAMRLATSFHALTLACLALFGFAEPMGAVYAFGWVLIAGFLVREHFLVIRHGLGRLNEAFFTLNASVSVAMFLFTFLDILVRA